MTVIASFFALTFILVKSTGILSMGQVEGWFRQAQTLSPIYIGVLVVLLLFADLFIAIPTLTVTLFAGYFLGFSFGTIASFTGMMLAGISGYWLSYYFGERVFCYLLKNKNHRQEAKTTFGKHGFPMILMSRAVPILPEVTACLAGMTKMPFLRFLIAWSLSTAPFVIIASFAGSISTLENPKPAIFTAIGISTLLWLGWYIFRIRARKSSKSYTNERL